MGKDKNNSPKGKTKNKKQKKYPSADIMLDIARTEYHIERERSDKLHSKAGIFITLLAGMITLYVQRIPFDKIKTIYTGSNNGYMVAVTVFLCLMAMALFKAGFAFYHLYKVIAVRPVYRGVFRSSAKKKKLKKRESGTKVCLVKLFYKIIERNVNSNEECASHLQKGMKHTVLSIIMLSVSAAGLLFCL